MELRVLIHAPFRSDESAIRRVIEPNHKVLGCDGEGLTQCIQQGAAAAILTEESLANSALVNEVTAWLATQPSWSDFPFIVIDGNAPSDVSAAAMNNLRSLGNVILLERPLNAQTLASAVAAAVRARQRQYATRESLEELSRARHEVERLNGELEERIGSRTLELASANDRLMKEIAERERVQNVLLQSQKMEAVGRLTGGIAHDFNNLLHVMNMNLELIALYAKDDRVKPVMERARGAAKRGKKLTGQLLSFSRNQSLSPKLTEINSLLNGIRDLLEISAGSGVEVQLELGEDLMPIVVDQSQLEMAVLNLASNSRDAMPEGGKLVIETSLRHVPEDETSGNNESPLLAGDYVVVSAVDTGAGISPQVLGKVFEPFFTTKPTGSSGLGLSQVYGFAQQSNGVARIRSEVDAGTTVEMWFPTADDEEPAPVESQAAPLAMPEVSRNYNILVVEDDADVRRVIVDSLDLIGYRVMEAANGTEGLAAIARAKPDLLVVDYAMPDITGAEVIKRAREMVGDLPVILATGYADMDVVERLAGKPMVLRKPFDIKSLGAAVAKALSIAPLTSSEKAPA